MQVLANSKRKKIEINGLIQGVGFRPFIYQLAKKLNLTGFVLNQSGSVLIEIQGDNDRIQKFIELLHTEKPELAKIEKIHIKDIMPVAEDDFQILESKKIHNEFSEILPDISICEECKKEILDPDHPRYLYPFTNCTNCGPRFTIIFDHPYDRIHTTMTQFEMCDFCKSEYKNPVNRRFHAEPISCHNCGPQLLLYESRKLVNLNETEIRTILKKKFSWLSNVKNKKKYYKWIYQKLSQLFNKGSIVAIKGLGGYHIACRADSEEVIRILRIRKKRSEKPFAVMFPDLQILKQYAFVSEEEEYLLKSNSSPIVLLKVKPEIKEFISEEVFKQNYIGAFLPYTPLHYLLLEFYKNPLIMTSANYSDDPICYKEDENFKKILEISDYVLIHNREIYTRCDDSVIKKTKHFLIYQRLSRGFVPLSLKLKNKNTKNILGIGAQLKNSISLLKGNTLIISQYIGDLDNYSVFESFLHTIELFKKLYYFEPDYIALDYHPDYPNTKWALKNYPQKKLIFVQHHHSHFASCYYENQLEGKSLGILLDGNGYGITQDHPKNIGGEIYLGDLRQFVHLGSLSPIILIGGDVAVKEVYRIGFSLLYSLYQKQDNQKPFKEWLKKYEKIYDLFLPFENKILFFEQMIHKNIQVFYTTSCGRLFDGISFLLGLCIISDYESHSAILLEQEMYKQSFEKFTNQKYSYNFVKKNGRIYIEWISLIQEIIEDIENHLSKSLIAQKFHNTVIEAYSDLIIQFSRNYKVKQVVLSGGCFQNSFLLDNFYGKLRSDLEVYFHRKLSPGDGSISTGQVLVASSITGG